MGIVIFIGYGGPAKSNQGFLVLDLNTLVGTQDKQVIETVGYRADNDGGGGPFFWDMGNVTASNGGTIIGTDPTGRWVRIYDDPIHSAWFGPYGDNIHDDTLTLQAWLNSITTHHTGYGNPGVYRITNSLNIPQNEVCIQGAQAVISGEGFELRWDSANSTVFAVYVSGYGTTIEGWSIAPTQTMYGGFHVGSLSGSLNTRCTYRNCNVRAGSSLNDPEYSYGFGVGVGSSIPNFGNQDFNLFDNCVSINPMLWGFFIDGAANALSTRLQRCAVTNGMGLPGQKMYVRTGQVDGLLHSYGGGIFAAYAPDVEVDGISFGYLETGFKRTGNAAAYDRLQNIDSEHLKKLYYVDTAGPFGTLYIGGTRCPTTTINVSSLGPDGYLSTDHHFMYSTGPVVSLIGVMVNPTVFGAQTGQIFYNNSIFCDRGSISAVGCILPGEKPYESGGQGYVVSWGCFGPDGTIGALKPVLNGAYKVHAGGFTPLSTQFDLIQNYFEAKIYPLDIASASAVNTLSSGYSNNNAGVFTISDAATTATVTLVLTEASAGYTVVLQPVSFTGVYNTIPANAWTAVASNQTTTNFVANIPVAPGVGNSITFRYEMKNDVNL